MFLAVLASLGSQRVVTVRRLAWNCKAWRVDKQFFGMLNGFYIMYGLSRKCYCARIEASDNNMLHVRKSNLLLNQFFAIFFHDF